MKDSAITGINKMFNFKSVTPSDIENMLYLITAYSDKVLAKRFNRLTQERKQKVTLILKERAKRAGNHDKPIDKDIIREVIENANDNFYIYKGEIYR